MTIPFTQKVLRIRGPIKADALLDELLKTMARLKKSWANMECWKGLTKRLVERVLKAELPGYFD